MISRLLAFAILSAFHLNAFSEGPLDGIYNCAISEYGATLQAYITINGHPDGSSVFAVAAVTPSTSFYGYGIGTATSSYFTGKTMFGGPFSLSAYGSSLSGTVDLYSGGVFVPVPVTCAKIW